ncbi:hypothetical protein ACLMJK_002044 [Lecanora helva]
MRFFGFIALSGFLLSFPNCLALDPIILPDIQSDISSTHLAQPSSSPSPQPSIVLPSISSITNITALSSLGFGTLPRPKDPSTFTLDGSTLSLRFSDYGGPLPIPQVLACLIQALLQSFDRVLTNRGDVPLESDLEFTLRHVLLIAYQDGGDGHGGRGGGVMTYDVLKRAVAGIVGFMLDYGSFAFNVEVLDRRERGVGRLFLTYI